MTRVQQKVKMELILSQLRVMTDELVNMLEEESDIAIQSNISMVLGHINGYSTPAIHIRRVIFLCREYDEDANIGG